MPTPMTALTSGLDHGLSQTFDLPYSIRVREIADVSYNRATTH